MVTLPPISALKIKIRNQQKDLQISLPSIRRAVRLTLKDVIGIACDEVSLHFVSKEEISELHDEFFNDPSITDCISFPIDHPGEGDLDYCLLGEVFVCPFVAKQYAKDHKADPYEETLLYIVHGLLHLAGFDDIETKDRKEMRKQEARAISFLKQKKISIRSIAKNSI